MGSCTRRHFLLSTCLLQLITIIERQVFDFLGYMWAPIFANFLHIIFVIFGFYGAYHFRVKYIITYLIWSFIWIGWNSFLICFYLDVGELNKDSDLLNLGTGSVSWFEVNGYGCKPTYSTNITSDDPYRPIRPERVDECLLDYELVEVIHSGVQCFLATLAIIGSIMISYIFLDEDDRFDFVNGDAKSPQHTVVHPMYVSYTSIPTSASATMLSINKHKQYLHNSNNNKSHSNSNLSNLHNHTIINNQYYDDSTATADQLFTNSNNKINNKLNAQHQQSQQQQQHPQIHPQPPVHQQPPQPQSNTTITTQSSTSYTSLNRAALGTAPAPPNSILSTTSSSYDRNLNSLSQRGDKSVSKGQPGNNNSGVKKCKSSSSYSSFINSHRPDIKYTQMSTEQLVKNTNFDESIEDIIALQTFNAADKQGTTYIPFQKPIPSTLFITASSPDNNNFIPPTNVYYGNSNSPNNNNTVVIPEDGPPIHFVRDNSQFFNVKPASNAFENRAYSNATPPAVAVPTHQQQQQIPRQFQRSGQFPYPDISPDVSEKYSMPYQYVPRSPVPSRISHRRRQDRSHVTNFCDQIRDTPPGYADTGFIISRAISHDRLSSRSGGAGGAGTGGLAFNGIGGAGAGGFGGSSGFGYPGGVGGQMQPLQQLQQLKQMQHANDTNGSNINRHLRRSSGANGSSGGGNKPRPRSYCNSSNVSYGGNNDGVEGGEGPMKNGSKKAKHRQSLYSIEFGPSTVDTIRNRTDTILDYDDQCEDHNGQLSPKPMTPRRVKRRSVMTRGSNSRHSTTSRRSHASSSNRNSMRSSRRKYQQNPVTKLLDQQQQQQQQQQQSSVGKQFASFQHVDNPALTASNLQSLNNEIVSGLTKPQNKYGSFTKNIPPDPIYYNTSGSTIQLQQSWVSGSPPTGLYNPTYQHSTPNLNDGEHVDELYNNRPPSVRSSYSNFHGARPLSSYNPTTENVFAGITGGSQQQQQQQQLQQQQLQQQSTHQHSHHHHQQTQQQPQQQTQQQHQQQQQQHQQHSPNFPSTPPQNIPFSKRTASRESIRSMAFLNSGPPAYNLNYHTPPDSETTM